MKLIQKVGIQFYNCAKLEMQTEKKIDQICFMRSQLLMAMLFFHSVPVII